MENHEESSSDLANQEMEIYQDVAPLAQSWGTNIALLDYILS